MEEIKRQVSQAQWRLNFERFLGVLGWSLFGSLLLAAIGLAVPKIWSVPVDPQIWNWSWIGGGFTVGVLIACIWTYCVRRTSVEAAIELDRRFGLKERISSSLTLTPAELESEAGQALLHDATKRVETLDVKEQFRVSPTGRTALPLIPAIAVTVLVFIPNFVTNNPSTAATTNLAIEKEVKKTQEELKKSLVEKKKQAEEKGLKDAEALFKQLQETMDEQIKSKDPTDQKKAMIKLNDLAKELQKRRDQLGGSEKVKDQMSKLKDIEQGPADKAIKSMQEGNFDKAQEEMKKLQDKLAKGELSKEEREQLGKQLEQMQKKVQEMAEKHEQAKKDLEEQIKEAEKKGDREKAGQLQQKLDQMKQGDKQMEKLNQMADKLGQAAEAAKQGDNQKAAEQLKELAKEMEGMQKEMDNLEMVDEMMNEVAQAKNGLCEKCEGLGEEEMEGEGEGQGKGKGKGKGKKPGDGLGEGQGEGDRPEEKTDTKKYDTRVTAKPRKGEAVRTGSADGPNMAGRTLESAKNEIQASKIEEDDALTESNLTKSQREHAKQYFEKLRKGE